MSNKPKIEFLSLAFALILPFNDLLSLTYSVRKLRDQNVAKQVAIVKEVKNMGAKVVYKY